ncbi:MAG TPA: ribosome small subunit-dependent GTPase A [Clostridia bacterium]|nr:ribosome small subunit-dependent GTPase A [Clostridia bacterium]
MASSYTVRCGKDTVVCPARKKVKNKADICVGDFVEVENDVIERVYEAKNRMIRPYVANIDTLLIVVAKKPRPDWVLVEKLLLNCHIQNIRPIICINKTDLLTEEEKAAWRAPYEGEVDIINVSALTGEGLDRLKELIKDQLVCFAGQSAVGKTSLLNALLDKDLEVGELSRKIERGKNTTRHVEIFGDGEIKVVDTCGFSVLETVDIRHDELMYYYDSFVRLQNECRYPDCTHTTEPDCAVKKAVGNGRINAERYSRYLELFDELKELWRKKYE